MNRTIFVTISTLITVSTAALATAGIALAGEGAKLELTFVDHVEAAMIEQDVYVEKEPGSGQLFRVAVEEAELLADAPVFAAARGVPHDPMNKDAIGPFEKGRELGLTLGKWLNASGQGVYACEDGKGVLEASFEGLVPNGVYTMWNFHMANPPTSPNVSVDLPYGARDGSQSVFEADADGRAAYRSSMEPCLQGSGRQLFAGLAIAYHSDGKTYGSEPGSMGDVSHIHLFTLLPVEEEMPK